MKWNALLDLVFPRACAGCGGRVGDAAGHLCWDCQAQLPFVRQPYCLHCGDPVEGRVDESFTCHWCDELQPAFDYARSVVRYRGPVQRMIQDFKYHAAHWLAPDLMRLLHAGLQTMPEFGSLDAIACVPLHRVRQRTRGYNQAALLAHSLAREVQKPFLRRALMRHRPTGTQTHLTARERVANVHGAFAVRRPEVVQGRAVLLVDDVMTTGATLSECARVLKAAGATRVCALTVARG
ncbi:MAG: ComF family protein [Verrucomicrobia bacterium]|nr:MAG: ComF family protein [Verrucomicrobiota bacterium]